MPPKKSNLNNASTREARRKRVKRALMIETRNTAQRNTAAEGEQDQPLFRSELTEIYVVTDATAPFFAKMNFKSGEGVATAQIKKIIREYISKHNLPKADPTGGTIQLDETLEELCNSKSATVSQICSAITGKMEYSYQIRELKDVASNKPLIQMSLATSGNKKVTLISNIECYGIIVPEFIKLCKQGAAASTTVVKLPHQKAEHLQIQGNQVRFVYNLLTETYKVPPKCILGLELAKDVKCHRKNLTSTTQAAERHDVNVLKELNSCQNKSRQGIQLKKLGQQKVVHKNLKSSIAIF